MVLKKMVSHLFPKKQRYLWTCKVVIVRRNFWTMKFLQKMEVPSGNMTSWKITTFNRKYIFNPGPFSIAMLVYQSDSHTPTRYQNLPLRKKSHSLTSPMFPSFSCEKTIWKNDPAQKREASKGCYFCMALLCFVCIPSEQRLITQRSHEP